MKKIIYLFILVILTMTFVGCDTSQETQQEAATYAEAITTTTPELAETVIEDQSETTDTSDADDTSGADESSESSKTSNTSETEGTSGTTISSNSSTSNNSSTTTSASQSSTTTSASQSSKSTSTNVSNEITLNNESLTITKAGTYYISGSVDNGQIIIDVGDTEDVQLVLKNVTINSNDSAPIYVKNGDEVTIAVEGNANVLSIKADISDNPDGVDGVIFSKTDLIFKGTGTLSISSNYTHGIVGKDDVEFLSGTYKIQVVKDGIQVNDSVSLVDSNMSITSGKDGIQVDNDENTDKGFIYLKNTTMTIKSGEDGIKASNYIDIVSGNYTIVSALDGIQGDNYVHVLGGTFNISSGGGYQGVLNIITVGEGSGGLVSETDKLTDSMKGIKSYDITIDGGKFTISSYEDALNANNDIVINGGVFTINSGDEAITAQNALLINDGTITIKNGYEGLEAVYITIKGGNITINVLDDGINGGESYSLVTISGGNLTVKCQGDGLDSNGDMVISGGYIVLDVTAIYAGGDGNVDVTGTLTYTGGTIVDAKGVTIDPTQTLGGKMPGGGGGRR